jgi:sugar phosphate isomerase/epimerase
MKLGLLTAALGELTLEQVAEWASGNGYAALEIACWPASAGAARRYAGVSHVDVERLDAAAVRRVMDAHGLEISALAYYPNNLDPDPEARAQAHAHLRRVIDAARALGVRVVGTFVGRDHTRPLRESLDDFRAVFPDLVRYAGERDVAIAIENCPMLFSADEWPGGKNLAYAPAIWRELFAAIPDRNFGLNLDPSHLIWQQIDPERCVRDFADRLLHVHAKDMEIDRDALYEHGVLSAGIGWQVPRLPGLGEVRWDRFIAALYRAGYDHVISVEHEDRGFEGDLARVLRGFEIARGALAPYIA